MLLCSLHEDQYFTKTVFLLKISIISSKNDKHELAYPG